MELTVMTIEYGVELGCCGQSGNEDYIFGIFDTEATAIARLQQDYPTAKLWQDNPNYRRLNQVYKFCDDTVNTGLTFYLTQYRLNEATDALHSPSD